MLINKLLLENRYIVVRSVDLNYLRYIMDMDMIPIVRWLPNPDIFIFACIMYGNVSSLKNDILISCIRPLNVFEIKKLLFNFNRYYIHTNNAKYLPLGLVGTYISINRNDLLC